MTVIARNQVMVVPLGLLAPYYRTFGSEPLFPRQENQIFMADLAWLRTCWSPTRKPLIDGHKQISKTARDIQFLSHELHSSKLQYLGIAEALRGFCKEFVEQRKVEINFDSHVG
jgi:hypothetical protein